MKERPILFSAQMVRALLESSKTQTRRAFSARMMSLMNVAAQAGEVSYFIDQGFMESNDASYVIDFCPYGQPGDRLWVRETWYCDDYRVQSGSYVEVDGARDLLAYRADGARPYEAEQPTWKPSIHMPRWASRINLEITGVRVERLQDISEADADAEGCERLDSEREVADWALCDLCGGTRLHRALGPNGGVTEDVDCVECDTYAKRYKHLWESINGAASWEANPWVWVVEFRRLEADQIEAEPG